MSAKVVNDYRSYLARTKNNGQILISIPDEEWLKREDFAREEGCICPQGKTTKPERGCCHEIMYQTKQPSLTETMNLAELGTMEILENITDHEEPSIESLDQVVYEDATIVEN